MPDTQEDVTALATAVDPSPLDQLGAAYEHEKIPFWPDYQSAAPVQTSQHENVDESSDSQQATPPQPPLSGQEPPGAETQDESRSHELVENAISESASAQAASPISVTSDRGDSQQPASPTSSARPNTTAEDCPPDPQSLRTTPPALPTSTPTSDWNPFALPSITPTTTSSFLRAGSCFKGIQKSEAQEYNVTVNFKYVDLSTSFLCGYLTIAGLTPALSCITTYFEAEIIGPHYTFLTNHPSWGATPQVDMEHWDKFSAFRPLARSARRMEKAASSSSLSPSAGDSQKPGGSSWNFSGKEHIFMRWKETFLVPDHRVREIHGASFEGFYYICASRFTGSISGIYYHARNEKPVLGNDHG